MILKINFCLENIINSQTQKLYYFALQRPQARTIKDDDFSHKIVPKAWDILNIKGHKHIILGKIKVTLILLKVLILPVGGVALGRVGPCNLLIRLV